MNIKAFRVDFRFKDAGYSPGDRVTSGGSYDTHHDMLVYAAHAKEARSIVEAYHEGSRYPLVIKKVKSL